MIERQGFKEMPVRVSTHNWNINISLLRFKQKDLSCHILGYLE